MELFTRSYDREWNRIVDLIVFNDKGISKYINDKDTYKFVLLEKGDMTFEKNGKRTTLKAPAFLLLSEKDCFEGSCSKSAKTTTLFFKPSVIREEFTFKNIDNAKEGDVREGTTLHQDYMLIYGFLEKTEGFHETEIQMTAYIKIKGITDSIKNELVSQKDGFWPCRSRSYLLELLYFICYNYIRKSDNYDADSNDDVEFGVITDYLREHINEEITLERLTKEMSINRNRLNEMFNSRTSMTCLNYLTKLRMELGSILLTQTDLRIGEICERIGYDDANYFTKAFKKETGMTPSEYRKNKRME